MPISEFSFASFDALPSDQEDFDCIEANDVLFVSCGEGYRTPLSDDAMLMPVDETGASNSAAVRLSSLLFAGSLPHLRWAVAMGILIASCFWMRSVHARWLWLAQGASPSVSLMGLAWVVTSADKTAALGWLALPAGMYSAAWGSAGMTAIYAVLAASGATQTIFYLAVVLKSLLWAIGHLLIHQLRRVTAKISEGEPISPGDWTIGWF